MHCDDCAALIDGTLRALPGVHTARATLETGTIDVELDPGLTGPATIADAITELGFRLRPSKEPAPAGPVPQQVSDAAWLLLEPVLRSQGRHIRDLRQVFEGIAYKWRSDVPWREVPTHFGPWQTLYARHAKWRAEGLWPQLIAAAEDRDDLVDELAWMKSAS